MQKQQLLVLGAAAVLFLVLYLGFGTIPSGQKMIDRSRALTASVTSFEALRDKALAALASEQRAEVEVLQQAAEQAAAGTDKALALKKLSGWWYRKGQLAIAGGLAEQVAEIEQADSSWSVAGATFFNGLVAAQDTVTRRFCAERAVHAFESAASLNPDKVEHRVNLALVYGENPRADNPMLAVMMLRELESKHPDNASVYNALGRLALKTGQWERAIQRLEKARSLEPANPNTPCLLARAYEGAGDAAKAGEFQRLCVGQ